MRLTFYILSFCACCLLTFSSCGDDDAVNCSTDFTQEFSTEIDNISTALTAFSMDPSSSNCESLKDAYNDYLDALDSWSDCAATNNQEQELQDAIDQARASLDGLVC